MADILDLDTCELDSLIVYGGAAGQKEAIRMRGGIWMVKYPESTREFRSRDASGGHLPSYTTSPLSEYIGSHVYASLGIPVHDTLLGKRHGKVVVACRDFTGGTRILDFASIKNSVSEEELAHGTSSNERGEYLSDVLRVIREAPILEGMRDEALQRFWDMFTVDALIVNNDRNNGNWGVMPIGSKPVLTPVYDNGQSFFNKKGASLMERQLLQKGAVCNNIDASVSFFLDDAGKHIRPFEFMAQTDDRHLLASMERVSSKLDVSLLANLIEEIPESSLELEVMPQAAKDFYIRALVESYKRGLQPAINANGNARL